MSCYVAAASAEIDRAERVISRLRARGVSITHDWCACVRSAKGPESALPDELAAAIAQDDLDGVREASVVLLLAPAVPSFGAGVEFGYALCRAEDDPGMTVAIAGPERSRSIFGRCALAAFDTDDAAIEWLVRLEGDQPRRTPLNAIGRVQLKRGGQ